MKSKDVEACLSIWRAAAEVAHPFLSQGDLDEEEVAIAAALRDGIQATVAVHDQCIAGFIALSGDAVAGLFVEPALQGNGIGRLLIRSAIQAGGARLVEVYEENVRSIGFYECMGYRRVERRCVDDLGRACPLIVMRLDQHGEARALEATPHS